MGNKKEGRQLAVVIALLRNKEGKILLQKRADPIIPEANEKWEFPGGRIEYGEDPESSLKRECLEEIGCEVKLVGMLGLLQSTIWKRTDGGEQHVLVTCYEAELLRGTPRPADQKVSDVQWFSPEEINGLDTLRGIKEFIEISNQTR